MQYGLTLAAILFAGPAGDATVQREERYELVRTAQTTRESNGSSGRTQDRDTIVERVLGTSATGEELEYDLPQTATADDRARSWEFPARVTRTLAGGLELRNAAELDKRVDAWLAAAQMTRKDCGRLIFTWNAFRIECDPASVLELIAAFDLRGTELRDGTAYRAAGARAAVPLKRSAGPGNARFTARLAVDPEVVRRDLVQTELGVAELTGQRADPAAAARAHARDAIAGEIEVTFETDARGAAIRRTTTSTLTIRDGKGKTERRTATEVVERRRLASAPGVSTI